MSSHDKGLFRGAHQGEGLGNKFLATIRECAVLLQVQICQIPNALTCGRLSLGGALLRGHQHHPCGVPRGPGAGHEDPGGRAHSVGPGERGEAAHQEEGGRCQLADLAEVVCD